MGIVTISMDDDIENELRKFVAERGNKKGNLGKAVSEAVRKMLQETKDKEIAERQMERSRKGLYKLPKGWKFNREEIYDRG